MKRNCWSCQMSGDEVGTMRRRIAAAIPHGAAEAAWVTMPGLAQLLVAVVLEDSPGPGLQPDYERRNRYLLMAVGAAAAAGVPVGFLMDRGEPDWPCVMFELPTGQVGWHLPRHDVAYDGHTTPEKNTRVDAWLAQIEEDAEDPIDHARRVSAADLGW